MIDSPRSLLEQVKNNTLFAGVDTEAVFELIADGIMERTVFKGDIIFQEGTHSGMMFLIAYGRVLIEKHTKNSKEVLLAELHTGDFFGELEMLDGKSRSARAIALDDTGLISLTKVAFETLVANSHAVTLNLLHTLSNRLRSMDVGFVLEHERNLNESRKQLDQLQHLIEAARILNSSLDLDQLLTLNLETALQLISADRGTLYLVDEVKQELWSKVLKASEIIEIRLPLGKGIAGQVAVTGEIYNNPNVYADPQFDILIDKKTGYTTQSMLCVPVKNKNGKITGVFQLLNKIGGVFTKQDEQFVEALSTHVAIAITNAQVAQQMVQTERLAAVGKMAATIVHDIKNPLTTLRLNAELLKQTLEGEELSEQAEIIINEVDRFVSMAQEILDFTRGVSHLNIIHTDIESLIHNVVKLVERDFIKRKISLLTDIRYTGTINIDVDKMMRVFLNIIGNAGDAMPKGGKLQISLIQDNNALKIEFSDNGIGMPPEIRDKMFEPFMTYGKKVGTGLGMAITKKIVEDHRGRIEVDSTLGKGTTIRLFLPL